MTVTLPETLSRSRASVTPALRECVARLDPSTRRVVEYHFGWTDEDGREVRAAGGKALRPALALLGAEACGVPAQVGVPGAVAVELIHNFSLLHDDVMDGDMQRRHRATAWTIWGTSAAILAGDALQTLAYEVLAEVDGPNGAAAGRLLARCTRRLIQGQMDDLAFESRDRVTLDECFAMAAAKTGSLLSASAAIGAVLAGAPPETVSALATYGEELGIAFQLVDDQLGIWGDSAQTGKPVGADLRARKKSLPITFALCQSGAASAELAAWFGSVDRAERDTEVLVAAALVEVAGGRTWAADEAGRRMALAEAALSRAATPEGVRADLLALGRYVVSREA
jgi:geranylgeranyl diphosphate synthase type I